MAVTEGATRAAQSVDDLYRAHAGAVFRYAYAMLGNRADAEDVTQTTFVNALRALERGERPRKPSNWLITISHNIVRQRFRQQQARPAEVELDHDIAFEETQDEGPSVEDLVRALQRIPSSQREALVMRELEGRSYKEIEAILELTPGALETLLFRARRSLADELENLVTCERAELAMSKRLDGRLTRKERRRLDAHLHDCPSCARLDAGRAKHRRAFGALSLLPLPFSFTFFREAPAASAAGGLSTVGAGGVTAAVGASATACGSACATGGLLAGGLAVKAMAVVAAATVASGVGYEGVKHVRGANDSPARATLAARSTSPLATSPLATSPLATSPFATSPLATSPLAAGPATLSADPGSVPRKAPAAAGPPAAAEDGYVLRLDPAAVPPTEPEVPQEFEIVQLVELPVAAPTAPEPEPSPVLTITLPPVETPPSAATTPPSTPPADVAPDTAAPAADTAVTPQTNPDAAASTLPPADTAPVDATPVQSSPPPATDTPPPTDPAPAPTPDPAPGPAPTPDPAPGPTATTDPTVTPASSTPLNASPAGNPGTVVPVSGG